MLKYLYSYHPQHIFQHVTGQMILLVLHGGVLNACYRHAMKHTYAGRHVNAAINIVRIEGASWGVVEWNDTSHLVSTGYLASAFGGGSAGG